jgi:hypothetical protein
MFEKFIEIFPSGQKLEIPDRNLFDSYATLLPESILQFWNEVGFGTQMKGYLKVINPDDYKDFVATAFRNTEGPAIVLGATAFADLLIWEKDCIKQLNFRRGIVRVASTNFSVFVNHRLTKWENIEFSMDGGQYLEALELLGPPAFDECYAYVPALLLGGAAKVENIQKVKLREHLLLLSGLVGKLEDQD